MPRPLATCTEDFAESDDAARFVQSVAKVGPGVGLGVDAQGEAVVSLDERLLLVCYEGAPVVAVHRKGRRQRVVLVDRDEVHVGARA